MSKFGLYAMADSARREAQQRALSYPLIWDQYPEMKERLEREIRIMEAIAIRLESEGIENIPLLEGEAE